MSFIRTSIPANLRSSRLGQAVPKAELRQLDQIATMIDIKEGRRIITEAAPGRECFVIVDGEFAVDGPGVHATVGAGEVTGELALLTGRRRNASVVAASDAAVYVMHPREFATLMSTAPEFCDHVVSAASGRLGSEPVTLPAQFVGKRRSPVETRPSWSAQLTDAPRR